MAAQGLCFAAIQHICSICCILLLACWPEGGPGSREYGSGKGKRLVPGGYQPTTYNQLAYKIEDTKLQRCKDAKDAKNYKDYKITGIEGIDQIRGFRELEDDRTILHSLVAHKGPADIYV